MKNAVLNFFLVCLFLGLITFITIFIFKNGYPQPIASYKLTDCQADLYPDWLGNTSAKIHSTTSCNPNQPFQLDGANDYLDLGLTEALRFSTHDSFTISVWFKQTKISSGYQGLVAVNSLNKNYLSWLIGFDKNSTGYGFSFCEYFIGCVSSKVPESDVPLNRWHHAVAVYDAYSKKLQIFNDGKAYPSISNPYSFPASSRSILVGFDEGSPDRHFAGEIKDLRFYNQALSPLQAQLLHHLPI